ncbi:amidohydrolase family protein [Tropicibacter alexandrii]|uniref:amidohydrolase family protein n=1 Tax=Tropicibacter alexandrii TaxID=2267683 RepID=UPI001F0C26B5|nr:amidohydrolase family protein [Tropicibacter alexandrii]
MMTGPPDSFAGQATMGGRQVEIVDAHQHFWHPARGDYGWMPANDPVLSRPYGPTDLAPALSAAGVSQTVLVQAAPSLHETEYLLGIADATPHVAAVVGWIDFEDRGQLAALQRLARHPKLKAIRPMIQDIPDDDWMLRDDVQWAFEALIDLDLRFDALGFPRHISRFQTLLTRHPSLRCVIDHCLKPQIRDGAFDDWAEGLRALARTGAFCKLSGLVTEAGPGWTLDELRPYVSHVLDIFGPQRVMWGSDWPVLRLRAEYQDWLDAAQTLTAHLDATDRARVFGGTARAFYGLEP